MSSVFLCVFSVLSLAGEHSGFSAEYRSSGTTVSIGLGMQFDYILNTWPDPKYL